MMYTKQYHRAMKKMMMDGQDSPLGPGKIKLAGKLIGTIAILGLCVPAFSENVDRSAAQAIINGSASLTFGVDFDAMDAGIENEATLNVRFPLLDSATRTTKDEGDFYGFFELRNLSFSLTEANNALPAKPGDSPTSLNSLSGQFAGSVADWLGNKPFSMNARLIYNPYPYTNKLSLILFNQVAQTGKPEPGAGLSFNKAEAVTTPIFKTYNGVTNLGEVQYIGMETGGAIIAFEGKKLRTAVKAFSHNETPMTARLPAWKDPEDKTWAVGADFRYDFVKDFLYFDTSAVYDFRDPDQNVNGGTVGAVTIPLGWGPVVGFQIKPAADFRYGMADNLLKFDSRLDLIALLSDADKDDQATLLMGSAYLGDDRDIEYALIFQEPLSGGWVQDVSFGFIISAMDILGNNPKPLPGITQDYGPSAQYGATVGWQANRKNILKADATYQTGLASYFATANDDGLLMADASDRFLVKLSLENRVISNTMILATWTSGDLLKMEAPFGILTIQTKVMF